MKKINFNNPSFLALQAELYQSNHEPLVLQGEKIRNNSNEWMDEHFQLSDCQLAYLMPIDPRAKVSIGLRH